MSSIDLSPKSLERIKALAQNATPGQWYMDGATTVCPPHNYKKELVKSQMGAMEVYRPSIAYCHEKADAAYIVGASPGVVLAMCEEIERLRERVATLESLSGEDDACMTQLEVERDALEGQVARLEKEADWLAREVSSCEHDQLDGTGRHIREAPELREAARKAVEGA